MQSGNTIIGFPEQAKYGLTRTQIFEAYRIMRDKGVKRFGIVRSTFIIDKQGTLRSVMYGVGPKGHALDVLRLVKELKP